MRVLVSGATGLIGQALTRELDSAGHDVVKLSRRRLPGSVRWDPERDVLDRDEVGPIDAIINLAGESIGGRWTEGKRRSILESRLASTRLLAALAADLRPQAFVSGSAIGFYGDRGDEVLTEQSPSGDGFLAHVVRRWESAAEEAEQAGIRTAYARTGLVLSADGGSLLPLLRIFKLGAGGKLGSGRQYWSWISLEDEARALRFLMEDSTVEGPVNLVSPNPVTNAQFAELLGKALRRPAIVPAPSLALRLALGSDFAEELLLASQRVVPAVLSGAGFGFSHPELADALAAVLAEQDGD